MGWLECPGACPHNLALVRATLVDDILASLAGEWPEGWGLNACPPEAVAATLLRPPLASFLLARKQSLHYSYGDWLHEPSGRTAKSVYSLPHLLLNFLGRAPFGGPPLGRGGCGCGLLLVSCFTDFL